MLLDGSAPVSSIPRRGTDATVLLVFNAWHEGVSFTLPSAGEGADWLRLFDTALETQSAETRAAGAAYVVGGRSVLALAAAAPGADRERLDHLVSDLPG